MPEKPLSLHPPFRWLWAVMTLLGPAMPAGAQNEVEISRADSVAPMPGSAEKLSGKQLNKGLVTSALDAISGKAAGVNVASSGSNRVAMLNSVRVRGTTSLTGGNDPLVIIDGVYSDLNTLSTIYPADIESFTIMKNASETAQYGSRGASGVIEVATKRGVGGQFHIAYDGAMGFDARYKYLDMLDAKGYVELAERTGSIYRNLGYDTNFQKEFSRTGQVQNHHIAFSGGSEKASYRASLAVMNHNTIVKTMDYTNFVAKLDISQLAFDDRLKIDFGVFGSSQKNDEFYDEEGLLYSVAAMNPTMPYHQYDGAWVKAGGANLINPPEALLHEKSRVVHQNFNSHLQLHFTLPYGLEANAIGSYSYAHAENGRFAPTWVWAQGFASRDHSRTEVLYGHVDAGWHLERGDHKIGLTLAGEYQKERTTAFWTQVKGFTSNDFGYNNLAAASTIPYGGTGSTYADPALASALMTASYTLMDRYAVDASLRADGSSMVGRNHTWGWFPSVSASWDVKREPFLRRAAEVSMLKVRTGYGQTGNLGAISSYLTLNSRVPVGVVSVEGTPTITMGTLRNSNPDLRWETRSTFNVGADVGFFNNRIILTAEYYYSKTTHMLYDYDVPVPGFAFEKLLANIGSMENSGVEIGFGFVPVAKKDVELNVNLNMSWQRNKLLSLSGYYNGQYMSASEIVPIGGITGAGLHGGYNDVVYQIVGQPLGVFYLPHCKGIVDNGHGDNKYDIADKNGDGNISLDDDGDRYVCGQATPKMTLGSNISLRYRDFDFTIQMNGAFGHKIFNGTSLSYMNLSSFPNYNIFKKAIGANIVDQNVTDYWLERGDYLNIDYITVGWNVPVKAKYVRALRLSMSCNNVATITGYSGMTPMINSYVVNGTLGIDDKRCMPLYRTFSFGINIQF